MSLYATLYNDSMLFKMADKQNGHHQGISAPISHTFLVKHNIKGYIHGKSALTQLEIPSDDINTVCSILSYVDGGHLGFKDGRQGQSVYFPYLDF